jgi:hypothetical protein
MNRANQQQLFQVANQAVLGIRQLEINYYSNLYATFGTQAILVGGFTYGTYTQNNYDYSHPYLNVFLYFYFVMGGLTIATAVHVMLCTMILQVFGPGLALHGPLGSMARAAEGLRAEQEQIIMSFIFMILNFAGSTVWVFWCVMSIPQALCCTVLFFAVGTQTYYYCERIYLRFYWNKTESNWNNGDIEGGGVEMDMEPGAQYSNTYANDGSNPMHGGGGGGAGGGDGGTKATYTKKKLPFPFNLSFKRPVSSKETADGITAAASSSARGNTNASASGIIAIDTPTAMAGDFKGIDLSAGSSRNMVAMEGYFTTKSRSEAAPTLIDRKQWDRRYFVLFKTGEFYIYKIRQDYRVNPKEPMYTRPLRLIDFYVAVDNTDQELRSEWDDEGRTERSAALTVATSVPARESRKALPFRFQLTLIPRENEEFDDRAQFRNHWLLRCDTEEELEIWIATIRDLSPSCFRDTPLNI